MADPHNYKEVYFNKYCKDCKHLDTPEVEDPCNECLSTPARINSHKPEKFEAKKGGGSIEQVKSNS